VRVLLSELVIPVVLLPVALVLLDVAVSEAVLVPDRLLVCVTVASVVLLVVVLVHLAIALAEILVHPCLPSPGCASSHARMSSIGLRQGCHARFMQL
jgi:hypothetical protein